jgi:hypothetical protein
VLSCSSTIPVENQEVIFRNTDTDSSRTYSDFWFIASVSKDAQKEKFCWMSGILIPHVVRRDENENRFLGKTGTPEMGKKFLSSE